MRPRFAVLGSLLSAFAMLVAPAVSTAAPRHNRSLTINVTPNPIEAGDGVLVYGQLNGSSPAGKTIVLYHHIAGSPFGFTRISRTRTDSHGFYEFVRAEGIVETNRAWFVHEVGAPGVHSRTVREHVAALVSASPSTTNTDTEHPVVFTGHVTPNHRFEPALLQQLDGTNGWKTVKRGRLGPGSNYAISYRFRVPGAHDMRVAFLGDRRNATGTSDLMTITVQQAQVADFTIATSAPLITYGDSAMITGTLYTKGTTTPDPGVAVTLCHRSTPALAPVCDTAGVTGTNGGYSFRVAPTTNQEYYVEETLAPSRQTARLFEGVRDGVTLSADNPHPAVGQVVTFTGTATPDKAGDPVYLQLLGPDRQWHVIAVRTVNAGSSFTFAHAFGTAGAKGLRALIPSDGENVAGASPALSVTVTLPPVASLPAAS